MNFAESVNYLYSLGNELLAMKFGLENIRTLAEAFDNPQQRFPAVHIAGTNGKGSTAAMVAAIARAAGLRAGLYTSPHLVSIAERIRIDGCEIAESDFARLATEVRDAGKRLVAGGELKSPPTFFEQATMIAYLHFAERSVDLAVLEVGMGGRLDATNICRPVVTAITPVAFDHQQFLGNTLRAIAEEKAGIVKPEVPVVVAPQHDEAVDAIVARCEALNAPLIRTSEPFGVEASDSEDLLRIGSFGFRHRTARGEYDARLNLRGRHQVTNALVAVHVAEELMGAGFDISQPAVVEGLGRVDWPGRLEMIRSSDAEATLLLDGAHNPAGARALREFIDEHFSGVPITLIFGAMADKAVVEMAAILFPAARRIILAGIANPRAAEPEAIAEETGCDAACVESAGEALEEALRITPPEGLIVVCGSLFLVGEVRRLLVGPSREF